MDDKTLATWLILYSCPGIGPAKFNALLHLFPDLSALLESTSQALRALGLTEKMVTHLKQPHQKWLTTVFAWREASAQHHIITRLDSAYPEPLRSLARAPILLFVKGNLSLLSSLQLAIVGARGATTSAIESAFSFAKQLSPHSIIVTSGLAIGIDGAAHRGTLDGGGKTIAVLGSGVDNLYPKRHIRLAQEILEQDGALVSEFAPNTQATAAHFPQRNRIISGLSRGVFVVEATLKSGSLITARFALEQGRDVFTMPGSIHNPQARGCHALLKQGAILVESIDDILMEWALSGVHVRAQTVTANNAALKHINFAPTPVDQLCARLRCSPQAVAALLLPLELEGYVEKVAGGYQRLK